MNKLIPIINVYTAKKLNKFKIYKCYSSSVLSKFDLKCYLLDVYNINNINIATQIIKRKTKNIKLMWISKKGE